MCNFSFLLLFFFLWSKRPSWRQEKGKKEIPVRSLLQMLPLPIKSQMASTSTAAAEGTESSLLSVYSPQPHSSQLKCINCESVFLSRFSLLCPLLFSFALLASPSPYFHLTSLSGLLLSHFLSGPSQTDHIRLLGAERMKAVHGVTDVQNTHMQKTHLSCYFYPEEQQLCLEWKWGRQAYRCWENPPPLHVHLSSFCCRSLFHSHCLSL